MFNIGPTELIVILIVALIVFGPKRLPEIGRTLGRSLQEFRRASNDLRQELEQGLEPPTATPNGQSPSPATGDTMSVQPAPGQASEPPPASAGDQAAGFPPPTGSEAGGSAQSG